MPDPDPDTVEAFLAYYPPAMRAISQHLRTLVMDAMPRAIETLYARHNYIGYALTRSARDLNVYICPLREYVRLGFMYGTTLPDPDHLLTGTGQRLRHIKVPTLQVAARPDLRRLVEAAWAQALDRASVQQ